MPLYLGKQKIGRILVGTQDLIPEKLSNVFVGETSPSAEIGSNGDIFLNTVYSRLPEGYVELEYIESTGTQWIDTGVIGNQNITLEIKATPIGNYSSFGCTSTSRLGLYFINTGAIDLAFGATGYLGSQLTGLTYPAVVTLTNGTVSSGNTSKTFTTQSSFNTGITLALFAIKNSTGIEATPAGRCYYCKIYENNILIKDFIPCRDPSGNIGMFDLVYGVFHKNQTDVAFTVGPEVVR